MANTKNDQEKRISDLEATKTLFQTKVTSGNFSLNNSDIGELQFNNLTVGKFYRISGRVAFNAISGGSDNIDLSFHSESSGGGTRYDRVTARLDGNGAFVRMAPNGIFQAVSTQMFCYTSSLNSGNVIFGDGGATGTKITLEELPDHEETNKFD